MTSINYNAASASAVRILQSVGRDLATTQNRIATGYKVNSAADNPSIWKAASTLRSDIKSYESASSSMDYAKGVYAAASTGADAVVEILTQIRTLVSTKGGSSTAADDTRLAELQTQLQGAVADGNIGGLNLLKGDTGPSIITSFSASGSVTVVAAPVTTLNLLGTTANSGLAGEVIAASYGTGKSLLTATFADMSGLFSAAVASITKTISTVSDYGGALAAASKSVESSQALMSKLADIKQDALSKMVDADLEAESAKLSALQIKQQLATQALSIANQGNQNILALFR